MRPLHHQQRATPSHTILSIPLGPRDVRTASLIAAVKSTMRNDAKRSLNSTLYAPLAATMLDIRSSIGLTCERVHSVKSLPLLVTGTLSLNAAFEPVRAGWDDTVFDAILISSYRDKGSIDFWQSTTSTDRMPFLK